MPDTGTSTGAAGWRPWQIYFALITLFITLSTIVYNAAVSRTVQDARTSQLEKEVQVIERDYERRDVVEQRLSNIESAERNIETALKEQNGTLQKLVLEYRRSR